MCLMGAAAVSQRAGVLRERRTGEACRERETQSRCEQGALPGPDAERTHGKACQAAQQEAHGRRQRHRRDGGVGHLSAQSIVGGRIDRATRFSLEAGAEEIDITAGEVRHGTERQRGDRAAGESGTDLKRSCVGDTSVTGAMLNGPLASLNAYVTLAPGARLPSCSLKLPEKRSTFVSTVLDTFWTVMVVFARDEGIVGCGYGEDGFGVGCRGRRLLTPRMPPFSSRAWS